MKTKYLILIILMILSSAIHATDPWGQPAILSYSMTVMAEVSVNNIPAAAGDMLAAFVQTNGVTQLRGKTPVQVNDGIAACLLQIYTETGGEEIIFRVWDQSSQNPVGVAQTMVSEVNGIVGHYPDSLYQIAAESTSLIADPWGQPVVLPGSMSIMAIVYIQDVPAATGDVIAAVVDDNGTQVLRGKAPIQVVDGVPGCLLQVFTASIGELVNFIVWDYDQQNMNHAAQGLHLVMDNSLGSYPDNMYLINPGGAMHQLQSVGFNPGPGVYPPTTEITLSTNHTGAQIRFTMDGSMPTLESELYTGQFSLPLSATTTVKAKAFMDGWYPSLMSSRTYTITNYVAMPVFSPPGGSYEEPVSLHISCITQDAQIRYTLNGEDPTSSSPLYSGPIALSDSTLVKARAFLYGWAPSQIQEAEYVFPVSNHDVTQTPAAFGISSAYPNPFRDQISIDMQFKDTPEDYELKVYNLKGECVYKRCGNAKGSLTLDWDGRDARGARLGSGIYLLSLQTGDQRTSRKVILY